jgi:hypothetical protein
MLVFDRKLTMSTTTATAMLNNRNYNFDWKDYTRGTPLYIYSAEPGQIGLCICYATIDSEGNYSTGACIGQDTLPFHIPTLTLLQKESKVPVQASYLPQKQTGFSSSSIISSASEASNSIISKLIVKATSASLAIRAPQIFSRKPTTEEERKVMAKILKGIGKNQMHLETVQTWATLHLQFPGFKLTPWKICKDCRDTIYLSGPSQGEKPPCGFGLQLPEAAFKEKLRGFGIENEMVTVKEYCHRNTSTNKQQNGQSYSIDPIGVKFIYDHYNTREAVRTLAIEHIRAQNKSREETSINTGMICYSLFDKNLLFKIKKLLE